MELQEEGYPSELLPGREGVLQGRACDDYGRDPEGVCGGRVVGEPPLLPG